MRWLAGGLISDLSDSSVIVDSWNGDGCVGVGGDLLLSLFIL